MLEITKTSKLTGSIYEDQKTLWWFKWIKRKSWDPLTFSPIKSTSADTTEGFSNKIRVCVCVCLSWGEGIKISGAEEEKGWDWHPSSLHTDALNATYISSSLQIRFTQACSSVPSTVLVFFIMRTAGSSFFSLSWVLFLGGFTASNLLPFFSPS